MKFLFGILHELSRYTYFIRNVYLSHDSRLIKRTLVLQTHMLEKKEAFLQLGGEENVLVYRPFQTRVPKTLPFKTRPSAKPFI